MDIINIQYIDQYSGDPLFFVTDWLSIKPSYQTAGYGRDFLLPGPLRCWKKKAPGRLIGDFWQLLQSSLSQRLGSPVHRSILHPWFNYRPNASKSTARCFYVINGKKPFISTHMGSLFFDFKQLPCFFSMGLFKNVTCFCKITAKSWVWKKTCLKHVKTCLTMETCCKHLHGKNSNHFC